MLWKVGSVCPEVLKVLGLMLCVLLDILEAAAFGLCLLEVPKMMRSVLLCLLVVGRI
jgi:hypothetical protein